jgi:hypothetical protein
VLNPAFAAAIVGVSAWRKLMYSLVWQSVMWRPGKLRFLIGVKNPLPIRPAATARKHGPLRGPRRSPDSRLQSGYALLSSRIRRHFLILVDGLCRIASPEMFPEAEMLPHLICSRPMFIGGAKDEADQHGGA